MKVPKLPFPKVIEVPIEKILENTAQLTLTFSLSPYLSAKDFIRNTLPPRTRDMLHKEGILPTALYDKDNDELRLTFISPPNVVYEAFRSSPKILPRYDFGEKLIDVVTRVSDLKFEEIDDIIERKVIIKRHDIIADKLSSYDNILTLNDDLLRAYIYTVMTYSTTMYHLAIFRGDELIARPEFPHFIARKNYYLVRLPVFKLPLSVKRQESRLTERVLSRDLKKLYLKRIKFGTLHLGLSYKCTGRCELYDIRFYRVKDVKRITRKPVNPRAYLLKRHSIRNHFTRHLYKYTGGSRTHIYRVFRADAPHDVLMRDDFALILPEEPKLLAETMFYKFEIREEYKL